ncbi:unnamed protein product, partial [marine sediment metagenome]
LNDLTCNITEKGYTVDYQFLEKFERQAQAASMLSGVRGKQVVGFTSPINWQEEVDTNNIVFSEAEPPDTWEQVRKIIATLRSRHKGLLAACGSSASLLAYHLVANIDQINVAGKNRIKEIQIASSGMLDHEWVRVKFSGYRDEEWIVLDITTYPGEHGYYGSEEKVEAARAGRVINYVPPSALPPKQILAQTTHKPKPPDMAKRKVNIVFTNNKQELDADPTDATIPIEGYHRLIEELLKNDEKFMRRTLEKAGIDNIDKFISFRKAEITFLSEYVETRVYRIIL